MGFKRKFDPNPPQEFVGTYNLPDTSTGGFKDRENEWKEENFTINFLP